jgi:hypothetical protein
MRLYYCALRLSAAPLLRPDPDHPQQRLHQASRVASASAALMNTAPPPARAMHRVYAAIQHTGARQQLPLHHATYG